MYSRLNKDEWCQETIRMGKKCSTEITRTTEKEVGVMERDEAVQAQDLEREA